MIVTHGPVTKTGLVVSVSVSAAPSVFNTGLAAVVVVVGVESVCEESGLLEQQDNDHGFGMRFSAMTYGCSAQGFHYVVYFCG